MALIVQKYGGTSVGSIEKIRNVAKRVLEDYKQGNSMVVVLSAMAGQTDGLIRLAKENINILMITTSEIKISCIIEEKYTELAVRVLHEAFELENGPTEDR